ncbi:hypothetical protein GGR56DRAFT_627812 [Xylariaceae sp. FL0804]|nr:hypothetical protein GGR56DRAFT_627812 [Xylariaceae sp. FL0804]
MSADLFAELVDFSQPTAQQSRPKVSVEPPTSQPSAPFSFGVSSPASFPVTPQIRQPESAIGPSTTQSNLWQAATPATNSQSCPVSANPASAQQGSTLISDGAGEDDDGWGDFEVASNVPQPHVTAPAAIPGTGTVSTETSTSANSTGPPRRMGIVRAPTLDLMSNNLVDIGGSSTFSDRSREAWRPSGSHQRTPGPLFSVTRPKAQKKPPNRNSDVLFDADDFEGDEDDFGDFETGASPSQKLSGPSSYLDSANTGKVNQKASELLLELSLLGDAAPPNPQVPSSSPFNSRDWSQGLTTLKSAEPPKPTRPTSVTAAIASPIKATADDWPVFDLSRDESTEPTQATSGSNWDWDSTESAQVVQEVKPTKVSSIARTSSIVQQEPPLPIEPSDTTWDWDPADADSPARTESAEVGLPPINIPPPSILLSIFPQVLDLANSSLYKPISGQPFPVKNRILSDPKTVKFLQGYLSLATVAARIIAGRKMRWHRDKYLAQSMSISAAGSKGMKLAGVDKAQATRDDREAADVVGVWKDHVGRLRSAVASANSSNRSRSEQLKIPEITETMAVHAEKGALTAPKACVICGLKRNERVSKVDHHVEDSFGEWWTDHWGHVICKRFWLQHEHTLRQR